MRQHYDPFDDVHSLWLEAPDWASMQPLLLYFRFVPLRAPDGKSTVGVRVVGSQPSLTGEPMRYRWILSSLAETKQFKDALASFKWAVENDPGREPDELTEILRGFVQQQDT